MQISVCGGTIRSMVNGRIQGSIVSNISAWRVVNSVPVLGVLSAV